MPLFVGGTKVDSRDCPISDILCIESLSESSKNFLSVPKKTLSSADRALYVSQREHATVSKENQTLKYIGSEDATTCLIVVLLSPYAISVGHFDGADVKNGLLNMIMDNSSLCSQSQRTMIEAHIFGGFEDERNVSIELIENILSIMACGEQEIHLRTACVYSLNTKHVNNKAFPLIYGVAVDIKTNEISPSSFTSKGPCELIRHARIFGGSDWMYSIYENESKTVVIGPFAYRVFRWAHTVLRFNDNEILQYLSTSPHCEPSNFVFLTRKAVEFLTENPNYENIFKNGRPLKFKMNDLGDWIQLSKDD